MDIDTRSSNLSLIIECHIANRIRKTGYEWPSPPSDARGSNGNVVLKVVEQLCEEFETKFNQKDLDIMNTCCHHYRDEYLAVLSEIVLGEINWGRVIAIITFCGVMATDCVSRDHPEEVDRIREWTCSFMKSKVEPWIKENGGLKDFVNLYGNYGPEEHCKWPVYATAIRGLYALGAMIIGR